ncbi:phosphatidate cytidylyltransferase [Legionella sp. 27cVA30]|uniref:phosphatidate cytidylyltransferase n=1 Tax=Legionella sp. 27cVA30 TaxID=2905657 RepID=UPI0020A20B1C|nr:phosphatidate cytidylyltransferase [Legionella sp. 27cVA30]MCP0913176.1 phosphatidate cytidylyltransferase [Legionella sp. 27cVA30]
MFKQRLITTLILIPAVLFAIYYAPSWLLASIVLLLTAAGAWEWSQLIPVKKLPYKILFTLLVLAATWLCMQWLDYWSITGLILWTLIFFAVLLFPSSQVVWGYPFIVAGAALALLPLFASSLMALYRLTAGKDLVVYLLALVWAADIGAYLAGKSCGRRKLIPLVSPGKTIEGTLGGGLLAMAVAAAGYLYFKPVYSFYWFILAAGTIFISILGDLCISILKRRCKLKDTGNIFPGHGGVLDRLDSQIAALPLFYCGVRFFFAGL